jgi:biopolymer transport protein ExbD
MADIAFLLLIFFIVATLPTIEQGLPIELPLARQAKDVALPYKINIWINKEGQLMVKEKLVSLKELAFLLSEKKKRGERFSVTINADKASRWQIVSEVLSLLKTLRVRKVHFIALTKSDD